MLSTRIAVLLFCLCSVASVARAQEHWIVEANKSCDEKPNCHRCFVSRPIDGDTFGITCVSKEPPHGPEQHVLRLFGIDAPENGERAKCDLERHRAETAAAYLAMLLASRPMLDVLKSDVDRYGRWVGLARSTQCNNKMECTMDDLSALMSWSGHARPWSYKTPKPNWCD